MKNVSKAAVAALTVAVAGLTVGTAGADAIKKVTQPLEDKLEWGACPPQPEGAPALDPRQLCATMNVPLNYQVPNGRQIELTVSKISTAHPDKRRGTLLLNPGGPGASGLDLPSMFAKLLPEEVKQQYDLIGFDPRGVGYSTPLTCGLGPADLDPTKVIPWPEAGGDITENVEFAKNVADQCAEESADLMPNVTTANTARDMDQIRSMLGEDKISYLGYSYGTYLGAVYATLFPQQTDRFVLDSAVDPTKVWREVWNSWGPAVQQRFPNFLQFVANNDDTYHLGQTPAEVRTVFEDLTEQLNKAPLELPGGDLLDGNTFREATRGVLYSNDSFAQGAQMWSDISSATTQQLTGELQQRLSEVTSLFSDVPADSGVATLQAITCNDAPWNTTVREHAAQVQQSLKQFPLTQGMPANVWSCAFWPKNAVQQPVDISSQGPANILIPQSLRDPATPHLGAENMLGELGQRARMLTSQTGGHGVYRLAHNACADLATTRFLTTGQLPDASMVCKATGNPAQALRQLSPQQQQVVRELRSRMLPL
ncbi:MAG: alpha/beta fold hydrolase [Streptosporangiales bacterium]|nr:alpha/beta fold hydrolase [Streptosporangiales bacterium]